MLYRSTNTYFHSHVPCVAVAGLLNDSLHCGEWLMQKSLLLLNSLSGGKLNRISSFLFFYELTTDGKMLLYVYVSSSAVIANKHYTAHCT